MLIYCDPTAHHYGGQGETRTPDVSGVGRLQRLVFATGLPTHIIIWQEKKVSDPLPPVLETGSGPAEFKALLLYIRGLLKPINFGH